MRTARVEQFPSFLMDPAKAGRLDWSGLKRERNRKCARCIGCSAASKPPAPQRGGGPGHGSRRPHPRRIHRRHPGGTGWPSMDEIEVGIFERQGRARRATAKITLPSEVAAWWRRRGSGVTSVNASQRTCRRTGVTRSGSRTVKRGFVALTRLRDGAVGPRFRRFRRSCGAGSRSHDARDGPGGGRSRSLSAQP